jgi:hypothetical protein
MTPGGKVLSTSKKYFDLDATLAVLFIVLFAVGVHAFQYRLVLGEADLYRVLNGMLDGAETNSRLGSDLHYGRDFGFGYILALYALIPNEALRDPDRLIRLINDIGFYSITFGLFFFWLSIRLMHGSRAATAALALFCFSPMLLELATSGHQVLIAFSFLSAAATCLFWPLVGWQAALAAIAGTILLICGLCVRAEIFLALPYLVLTRLNTTSLQAFSRSVLVNALSPTAALIIFFVLKHYIASFPHNGAGFFEQFYHWSNVVPGLVYMSLGCGIATVLVGTGVVVFVIIRLVRSRTLDDIKNTVDQLIGPIALTLVPFAFWIANPQPSRHFLLVLAGFSILIGWAISHLSFRLVPALVTVLGLIATNQVLSEAARPALLRINAARSPYRPPPEFYNTFTHAPLGWSWQHHAALKSRLLRWKALGDMVATACDANTVIFSDESEQIFSRLYAGGAPVQSSVSDIHGFVAYSGTREAHHFVFISKMTGWPKDAVATILADPNFNNYQLYADPYLLSIYDRVAIPVSRLAKFGC